MLDNADLIEQVLVFLDNLAAFVRVSKQCAAAAAPALPGRKRAHLFALYRYMRGPTPCLVEGAYYWLDCDTTNESVCDYSGNVLLPMLGEFGAAVDEFEWIPRETAAALVSLDLAQCDRLLKCTKVSKEACTFEFARQCVGHIVVPTHSLKWLCLAEVQAEEGVVVELNPDDMLPDHLDEDPHVFPDQRWIFSQDDLNGVECDYDSDREVPHARAAEELYAREVEMTTADLNAAIAQLRGPVFYPPLTKQDAPTYCLVRRKMLVPAFRKLRGFGVQCAHDLLVMDTHTIRPMLCQRYGYCANNDAYDSDDCDEGAYVGYGNVKGDDNLLPFYTGNEVQFQSLSLYHNLGRYKRCRVRATLERVGFNVNWNDSRCMHASTHKPDTLAPPSFSAQG